MEEENPHRQGNFEDGQPNLPTEEEEAQHRKAVRQWLFQEQIEASRIREANRVVDDNQAREEDTDENVSEARRDQTSERLNPDPPKASDETVAEEAAKARELIRKAQENARRPKPPANNQ